MTRGKSYAMNRSFLQSALLLALLATTATALPGGRARTGTRRRSGACSPAAQRAASPAPQLNRQPTPRRQWRHLTRARWTRRSRAIKKDVVDLNRDLFVLEEELLFPANTQVAVFLSMDVGAFFALDTVELRMDDKQVAKYLYTPREAEALLKGGVQRLYLGNLRSASTSWWRCSPARVRTARTTRAARS